MCWFLILCECVPVACKKHGSRKAVPQSSNQTEVIQRLSNFFGIDRIPGRIFRKPPPDYMMDLYNSITDSGGLMKRESPYKADVIRSFPDRRKYHFRCICLQFECREQFVVWYRSWISRLRNLSRIKITCISVKIGNFPLARAPIEKRFYNEFFVVVNL